MTCDSAPVMLYGMLPGMGTGGTRISNPRAAIVSNEAQKETSNVM